MAKKNSKVDVITEKTTDEKGKEFKGSGVEGKKDFVTGEDVIKSLRKKGYKI